MNVTSHAVSKPLRNLPASFWLRRRQKRAASVLALGAVFAGSLHPVSAAPTTYYYTGNGSNGSASTPITGNFSTGFNPNVPNTTIAGSTYADTLSFGGTTNYTAYDDLAQQVLANSLSFSNSGAVTLERQGTNNSISLGGTTTPTVTTAGGSVLCKLDLSLAATTKLNIGGGNMTITGLISDSGRGFGLTLTSTANGGLTLTGANTYSGATTLNNGALTAGVTSVANKSGAFGNNSALILANTSGVAVYLINTVGNMQTSYDTQVGSLSGGGTSGGGIYLGTATLTIGGNNTSTTYAGVISAGGKLTKMGTGTQTLTGANTYTGTTTLNGGNLNVGSTGALGSSITLDFGGGTLQYSAANQIDYSKRFSTAAGQAYSIDTNSQNVTFATGLTSSGGTLTKSGAGTLILMGTGNYNNGTTVTGGTLSGNATSYGPGAITVGNGATLDYTQSATTGTAANNISGGGSATFGGVTTGNGTGGTNANGTGGTVTYTGQDSLATTVKSGTVVLNNPTGSALSGPVTIATSGTVQLGANSQIQTSAQGTASNITLNGGTLNAAGHSDGTINGTPSASPTTSAVTSNMGTLTLSSSSTLDFGLNSTNSILAFANSSGIAWSGTLKIIDYTGGTDALYIGNSSSGLTSTQLSQISFNGLAARQLANGQLVAAPEPSTLLSLLIGTAALGGLAWRRRRSAQQES